MLIADHMAFTGYGSPLTYTGATGIPGGPLQKASFERPVEVMKRYSAFGSKETAKDVTVGNFLGSQIRIGTGVVEALPLEGGGDDEEITPIYSSRLDINTPESAVEAKGKEKIEVDNREAEEPLTLNASELAEIRDALAVTNLEPTIEREINPNYSILQEIQAGRLLTTEEFEETTSRNVKQLIVASDYVRKPMVVPPALAGLVDILKPPVFETRDDVLTASPLPPSNNPNILPSILAQPSYLPAIRNNNQPIPDILSDILK
jgi:hypothetical protein